MLGLARRLGLSNATFWRHFRDIATEIRQIAASSAEPAPGNGGNLAEQNTRLRRERDHLTSQLDAALGHLRRLTTDNARLRHDLEAARSVTRLDPGRASQKPPQPAR